MFLKEKKPVTIIAGYLGAGKTTVLNELLKNRGSERYAIVVNDRGSINIDASLVRSSSVYESDVDVVELSNGCICCTLQDAFLAQINDIATQYKVDRILVEASGISDSSALAAGFVEHQKLGLCDRVYLDAMVCVVDADRMCSEFLDASSGSFNVSSGQEEDIVNLVIDQIEFCNIVLLNKCDLLPLNAVEEVRKTIRAFQKDADLYECIQGKVNPDKIFNNGQFDYDKVLTSSRIQSQLYAGKTEDIHDAHGIASFLYEEKDPFDYEKFMTFLKGEYPENIIRAKGYVWFADADTTYVRLFEQAGRNVSITEIPDSAISLDKKKRKRLLRKRLEHANNAFFWYDNRVNQVVFIGKDIDPQLITVKLQACVCKERYAQRLRPTESDAARHSEESTQ